MSAGIVGLIVGTICGILGLRYDRRTDQQKLDSSRRALGYALGVPRLFDDRGTP